mmetsp:Transcript_15375/g.39702  ORF Transcript_15375/g.39702 Transcript_15375/m.39702 type:complete len:381 (+) Transcript_15375:434-1576(+)
MRDSSASASTAWRVRSAERSSAAAATALATACRAAIRSRPFSSARSLASRWTLRTSSRSKAESAASSMVTLPVLSLRCSNCSCRSRSVASTSCRRLRSDVADCESDLSTSIRFSIHRSIVSRTSTQLSAAAQRDSRAATCPAPGMRSRGCPPAHSGRQHIRASNAAATLSPKNGSSLLFSRSAQRSARTGMPPAREERALGRSVAYNWRSLGKTVTGTGKSPAAQACITISASGACSPAASRAGSAWRKVCRNSTTDSAADSEAAVGPRSPCGGSSSFGTGAAAASCAGLLPDRLPAAATLTCCLANAPFTSGTTEHEASLSAERASFTTLRASFTAEDCRSLSSARLSFSSCRSRSCASFSSALLRISVFSCPGRRRRR